MANEQISTKKEVSVLEWDPRLQFVTSKTVESSEINKHLVGMRMKLTTSLNNLERNCLSATIHSIKNEFNGIVEKPRMLLEIIKQHNDDIEKLIGRDYTYTSWRKYRTMYNLVKSFIKWKFRQEDVSVESLKFSFITDYEFYLKVEKKINPATNPKYLKNLQKIIRQCVVNEWMVKDPFLGYKLYAKILDKKVSRDMLQLREVLTDRNTQVRKKEMERPLKVCAGHL